MCINGRYCAFGALVGTGFTILILQEDIMKIQDNKNLTLYTFLSFVFIVAAIAIATTRLSTIPAEYTIATVALLLGALGALQCQTLQKRKEQFDALNEGVKKFKLTSTD